VAKNHRPKFQNKEVENRDEKSQNPTKTRGKKGASKLGVPGSSRTANSKKKKKTSLRGNQGTKLWLEEEREERVKILKKRVRESPKRTGIKPFKREDGRARGLGWVQK